MQNKVNYHLKFNDILKSVEGKLPTLLLHSCCAPCSSYVLSVLIKHFDITVFYYNPNITDEQEYLKRVEEQKKFIDLINSGETEFQPATKIKFIDAGFNKSEWESVISGLEQEKEGGARCYPCYNLRLQKTCKLALQNNFEYFGTTLSVSPYKNSNWLNQIGEALQTQYGVKYLYADFKKNNGYKLSIEYSYKYNLYRQNYCGCVYSKRNWLTQFLFCYIKLIIFTNHFTIIYKQKHQIK